MLTTHVHTPDLALQPHADHHVPVAARGHMVVVDLGDAALYLEHADRVHWGAGDPDMAGAGRVLRWCQAEIVAAPVA